MTTVLFVEDQFELRAIHGTYLTSHGLRVLTADDAEEALAVAKSEHPDVVVLDHSLPGKTGAELARELRQNPATSGIPLIMMTAHTYGAVGRKARAAGCVAFLAKPVKPSRVLQEILKHSGADARRG